MTAEKNIEIARRWLDAWNRNDWDTMEALSDRDAVVRAPEGWPEAGEFEGWPAIRRQYERLKEPWSDERLEILELRPAGQDKILVHVHWLGHGEASGLELDLETWNVNTITDGLVVRTEFYLDGEEAQRAAGLSD